MTDFSNKGDKILSLTSDRLIIKSTWEVTLNGNFNFMGKGIRSEIIPQGEH